MEIYMKNIPSSTKDMKLKLELANILHVPPFRDPTETLFNFNIFLFKQRKRGPWRAGALTLPSESIGSLFLQLYGGPSPLHSLLIDTTRVQFHASNRPVRRDVVERILRTPFQDPREAHAREEMEAELKALQARISTIQFGCECRDQVYSVEWEKIAPACLGFDGERREFRICMDQGGLFSDTRIIAIRVNAIYHVSATFDDTSRRPIIFFSLTHPPTFESESAASLFASILTATSNKPTRSRWSSFDDGDDEHALIAPYTSLAIRLECESIDDLRVFRQFVDAAHLRVYNDAYPVVRRGLFSSVTRAEYHLWMTTLPWTVAFQIEALVRSWLINMAEALSLRGDVDRALTARGVAYTAALLRDFASHAKALYWYGGTQPGAESTFQTQLEAAWSDPVTHLFSLVEVAFVYKPVEPSASMDASAPFQCLHVTITPTTMILEGPFPERSNRVMRTYFRNQECFIRVSFQDENRLQFRFDRDVDGRGFINRRVRGVLRDGITIAGAHFRFLAYSQSALKEHAVWFVKPFRHRDEQGNEHFVDATTIIQNLGNFRVSFDPDLVRCPARYAARISQAFTATDASISVSVEQLEAEADIKDSTGKYFTDGVGTISPELAKDIWRALRERGRRGRRDRTYPRAYQVRFQGSKGMLSVDYTLSGRAIVVRPSMIKFEAPQSLEIEVARAFDKPGPYFLNRPLIMLLEGLGVPYETFKHLQDDAVHNAQESVTSLERSARLLEAHGLGVPFRLTSAMLGLHKLGLGPLDGDVFWRQMMDFAVNHVLRELKHHARIPVPGKESWTLVGVADVHQQLREGEVFACVDSPNESSLIYLEGPTLISRSPTIHPGDVQVVQAIGRPPAGTPLAKENLRNTVVFSTQGERPLPSCLGGGDLDGDLYNVSTRRDLLPPRTHTPASYDSARKKLVDHESTMDDVADFVAEYISSDTLGMIAITWLIIADQSPNGIFDPDCIKLAALHSDAVDYPKSGQPVPANQIPKLQFRTKPDWNAPETIKASSEEYYPSSRAIGKLFRLIDLPALQTVQRAGRSQRRRMRTGNQQDQHADILEQFYNDSEPLDDEVGIVIQQRVAEFIDPDEYDDDFICQVWDLYNSYTSQLRAICADHTLEHKRTAMLTEEEAVVGTIVAKCSQPRKRKDLMSQMREQTSILVSSVKAEIAGGDDVPFETSLRRAWIAYRLASMEGDVFGARSFVWIALGNIFDTIKEIEEEDRAVSRR